MLVASYPNRKALKAAIGKPFRFEETSLFGSEYQVNKMLTVVGPSAYERKWYANVWTDENDRITKVK